MAHCEDEDPVVLDESSAIRKLCLHAQGRSWAQIAGELGCSVGTANSAYLALSKNPAASPVAAD